MEKNVPKKEVHDYTVVVNPLGIIRTVVIECLYISGYQSFHSSEANSYCSLSIRIIVLFKYMEVLGNS